MQEEIEAFEPHEQIDVMALGTGMSFAPISRIEMHDLEVVKKADEMEKGGEVGDLANVIAENRSGVVMKVNRGKFLLKFPDGTEKAYSAEELKFIDSDDDFEKGGKTKYWIQGAMKKKGALRAEAKRMGLIKGDEKLTMEDLKKLEAKGGKTAQRARLAMTLQKLRGGGKVKFKDKVAAVKKSLLERKKVPKSVQKDYGKTYSPAEAQESAQRIVGARTAAERLKYIVKNKKGKK